jgi:hypothetical protein
MSYYNQSITLFEWPSSVQILAQPSALSEIATQAVTHPMYNHIPCWISMPLANGCCAFILPSQLQYMQSSNQYIYDISEALNSMIMKAWQLGILRY